MKTGIIAISTIAVVTLSSFSTSSAAQNPDDLSAQSLSSIADHPPGTFPTLDTADTSALQGKILFKINDHLTKGTITAAQASNLKDELNSLNLSESWYKSMNMPIPDSVLNQDKELLNQLEVKIERKPASKSVVSAHDALHSDVDELISKALAGNKISSNQAEVYYSRLAQIESVLQSNDVPRSETAEAVRSLSEMKSSLLHK